MKKNSAYRHVLPFLVPTLVLALVLSIAILVVPKAELHLALCQPHTEWLDKLVPFFTNLVDWLPYLAVVLLLFYRAGWATFLASNLLLSTLIVQPIKHIVHAPRPITWFAENMPNINLPLVDGVKMNLWLSFPSGHTTTFFVVFFTLSIILCTENVIGKNILSFICFLCAVLEQQHQALIVEYLFFHLRIKKFVTLYHFFQFYEI